MGCPTAVIIGDNLVFSVTTHNPSTGALTNADAVPAYRIYEDETSTPIASGNMAALDAANTTGFYSKQVACTLAIGYEVGKTYTVYISATVNLVKGAISYGFKMTGSTSGAGAITWTYTLTNASGGLPIADADIWITTDVAGTNVIASGRTNASGVVTFFLDAGQIYVWRQKSGFDFVNPDSETVS